MPTPEINPVDIISSLPNVSHVVRLAEDGTPMGGSSMGSLPNEWWSGLEQFASSLNVAFKDSAKRISETNKTPYEPIHGWFYTGGDWGVCVVSLAHLSASLAHLSGADVGATESGFVAAFFLTERADSKAIFDAMIAQGLKSPGH